MILKLRNGKIFFPRPFGERVRGYNAFTLAEVLITLGIIGVVASMTMPTLIAHYKEKAQITAIKKVYSEISQANQLLNAEYGGNWTGQCDDFDNICFRDLFATKLKVLKTCDKPISEGCQAKSTFLDGTERDNEFIQTNINDNNWAGLLTNSGYSLKFRFHFNGCSPEGMSGKTKYLNIYCGWVQADINGLKGPNVAGKDIFFFQLNPNLIFKGFASEGVYDAEANTSTVNSLSTEEIEENCKNGTGTTCSAMYLLK